MNELISNLEEDIDLLIYDREPTDEEKKIAADIVKALEVLKNDKN